MEILFLLLVGCGLVYIWRKIDPKLDWNYQTGERILWYNDPFDLCERKAIILYKDKTKINPD